jgi:hypothetical protein
VRLFFLQLLQFQSKLHLWSRPHTRAAQRTQMHIVFIAAIMRFISAWPGARGQRRHGKSCFVARIGHHRASLCFLFFSFSNDHMASWPFSKFLHPQLGVLKYGFIYQNSFTLEASLCGPDICRRCSSTAVLPAAFRDNFCNCKNTRCDNRFSSCCHFNVSHYLHLGFCFCGVILDFWDPDQVSQSHTPTSCPSSPYLSFRIHTHIHPSHSQFNAVLQELLASGDSLAEIGGWR